MSSEKVRKSAPAIAFIRREKALGKFDLKLKVLSDLIEARDLDKVPSNLKPSTFVAWHDSVLGIEKISRNCLYEKSEDYVIRLEKMTALLGLLTKLRAGGSNKESKLRILTERITFLERQLAIYINEYSMVRAELVDKNTRIIDLSEKIKVLKQRGNKVVQLYRPGAEKSKVESD